MIGCLCFWKRVHFDVRHFAHLFKTILVIWLVESDFGIVFNLNERVQSLVRVWIIKFIPPDFGMIFDSTPFWISMLQSPTTNARLTDYIVHVRTAYHCIFIMIIVDALMVVSFQQLNRSICSFCSHSVIVQIYE